MKEGLDTSRAEDMRRSERKSRPNRNKSSLSSPLICTTVAPDSGVVQYRSRSSKKRKWSRSEGWWDLAKSCEELHRTASEQRGNTLKDFKDLILKETAIIWPLLSTCARFPRQRKRLATSRTAAKSCVAASAKQTE